MSKSPTGRAETGAARAVQGVAPDVKAGEGCAALCGGTAERVAQRDAVRGVVGFGECRRVAKDLVPETLTVMVAWPLAVAGRSIAPPVTNAATNTAKPVLVTKVPTRKRPLLTGCPFPRTAPSHRWPPPAGVDPAHRGRLAALRWGTVSWQDRIRPDQRVLRGRFRFGGPPPPAGSPGRMGGGEPGLAPVPRHGGERQGEAAEWVGVDRAGRDRVCPSQGKEASTDVGAHLHGDGVGDARSRGDAD